MELTKGKRYIILVIASLICGMVYLTPFLRFTYYDQMLVALSITDAQMGGIGGIYGIAMVCGYLISGWFSEKFTPKVMLSVSLIGMLAATLWYVTFPPYEQLLVIHFLYGIFSVWTFWSSYVSLIRSLGSDSEQGRFFGLSEGIRGLGNFFISTLCLSVMGLFVEMTAGFRALLWVNIALFAILLIALIIFVPNARTQTGTADGATSEKKSTLEIIKVMVKMLARKEIWICIILMMSGYVLWNTVNGFVGTFSTRILNIDPSLSSMLSNIRSYLIVFLAGLCGFLIDKFKTKGMGEFVAFTGCLIFTLFTMFTPGAAIICLAMSLVLAFMVNVIKSTYWSVLGEAGISREETGTATAIISMIAFTADSWVPIVVSQFIEYGNGIGNVAAGFNLMFIWMIVWCVIGMGACLILRRHTLKLRAEGKLEEETAA